MKRKTLRAVTLAYGLMAALILLVCGLFSHLDCASRREFLLPNVWSMLLGAGVYAALACLCARVRLRRRGMMEVLTMLLALGLFVLGYHYCFATGWDVHRLMLNAEYMARGQFDQLANGYYSNYPNNVLLTVLFSLAYKVGGRLGVDAYWLLLAVQSLIYAWSGYFWYRSAQECFGQNRWSLLVWLIYVLLLGLSPWLVIPYSDSFSLLLVSFGAFCTMRARASARPALCAAGLVFSGVLGYFIKPQTVIWLIACGLIALLHLRSLRPRQLLAGLLAAALAVGLSQAAVRMSGFHLNREQSFGVSHFLMMGWNPDSMGGWNEDDVKLSQSAPDSAQRTALNLRTWRERMEGMGPSGVLRLAAQKTLTNFGDGTFAWSQEGTFYREAGHTGHPALRAALSAWYHENGSAHAVFAQVMQVLWMGTLLLSAFARSRDGRMAAARLAFIGLALFVLLFEARARYVLAYAPVCILLAVDGLRGLPLHFDTPKETDA